MPGLSSLQAEFCVLTAKLILKAEEMGYQPRWGDAYRDPRVHGDLGVRRSYSHPRSAHKVRLAVDILLNKDGEWLQLTEDYRPLGEWWEKQHQLARWGGRFSDGNHFSFEWNGVK